MRKWVRLLAPIALALGCASAVRAQEPPPKAERPKEVQRAQITQARARDIALARVGGDLQGGSIPAWKGKAPSGLKVVSASSSNLGGRAAYIVAVQMMKSTGIVRVTLNANTGEVLESRADSWDWGNAPAWYKQGLSSPPPAKSR